MRINSKKTERNCVANGNSYIVYIFIMYVMATYLAFYHSKMPPFPATINSDVSIIASLSISINLGKHLEHTFKRGLHISVLISRLVYIKTLTRFLSSTGPVVPHIWHRKVSLRGIKPNTPWRYGTPPL